MWIIYLIIISIVVDFIFDGLTDNIKKMRDKTDSEVNARLDNIEQYLLKQNKKK